VIESSLRFRLLSAAAFVILLALPIAGAALLILFERNVMRQIDHELDADIEQLIANIERDNGAEVELATEPADPRFRQPQGGRYWQIAVDNGPVLRSRSLWDDALDLGTAPDPKAGVKRISIRGPGQQPLYAAVRSIILEPDTTGQTELRLVLAAAMDAREIAALKAQFRGDVAASLGLLALLLISAAWVQVSIGLKPFETLRAGLEKIRLGQRRRLSSELPRELQPLAAETNRLLEVQEKAIDRGRARAGDLAHGLKTPLTALMVMAQRLRDSGQGSFASDIEAQLRVLNAHIERELARTRIAADAGIRQHTLLSPILDRVVRTMQTLPGGDDIDWRIAGASGISLSVDEADFAEILGNVLDNARKWARFAVEITARKDGDQIELTVEDDGPGVPVQDYGRILRRGLRLDESMPGTGLGLTILKEVVEAYGGRIELGQSRLGGLRLSLRIREG
jgi:signal transduction histidine kinase